MTSVSGFSLHSSLLKKRRVASFTPLLLLKPRPVATRTEGNNVEISVNVVGRGVMKELTNRNELIFPSTMDAKTNFILLFVLG